MGKAISVSSKNSSEESKGLHTINSVGGLSVAKVMGAMHAVLGLLFLPFFLLISLVASMAPHPQPQSIWTLYGDRVCHLRTYILRCCGLHLGEPSEHSSKPDGQMDARN
jgi:hypothetical protein